MEPQPTALGDWKLASPSRFIYDDTLRNSVRTMPTVGIANQASTAPSLHFVATHQSSSNQHGGYPAFFAPYYNPPKFSQPWDPGAISQQAHSMAPMERGAYRKCARDNQTVSFRQPFWGCPTGGEHAAAAQHTTPRIVELDGSEDGFSPRRLSSVAAPADDVLSPKTRVVPNSVHQAAWTANWNKTWSGPPAQSFPVHAPAPPRLVDRGMRYWTRCSTGSLEEHNLGPKFMPAASQAGQTTALVDSASRHNGNQHWDGAVLKRKHQNREAFITASQHPSMRTVACQATDNLRQHDIKSHLPVIEECESLHNYGIGEPDANMQEPTNVDYWDVEHVKAIEKVCLEATKLFLQAHITNYHRRADRTRREGVGATSSLTNVTKDKGTQPEHEIEDMRDRDSPIKSPRKYTCRSQPYPCSAPKDQRPQVSKRGHATIPCHPKDRMLPRLILQPEMTGPVAFSPSKEAFGAEASSQSNISNQHPRQHIMGGVTAVPSQASRDITLSLTCTDSLLHNISSICNLIWHKAARVRLLSLNAEMTAVCEMQELLQAAELVVSSAAAVRATAGRTRHPRALPDPEAARCAADGDRSRPQLIHETIVEALGLCRRLGHEAGLERLEIMEEDYRPGWVRGSCGSGDGWVGVDDA